MEMGNIIDLEKLEYRGDSYMELFRDYLYRDIEYYIETFGDEKEAVEYVKNIHHVRGFIINNNFSTKYTIFEGLREIVRRNPDIQFEQVSIYYNNNGAFDMISKVLIDTYLSYRFNQALALAFLSAYGG